MITFNRALKKLVDRGYAVPPPGAALYQSVTSKDTAMQEGARTMFSKYSCISYVIFTFFRHCSIN